MGRTEGSEDADCSRVTEETQAQSSDTTLAAL